MKTIKKTKVELICKTSDPQRHDVRIMYIPLFLDPIEFMDASIVSMNHNTDLRVYDGDVQPRAELCNRLLTDLHLGYLTLKECQDIFQSEIITRANLIENELSNIAFNNIISK